MKLISASPLAINIDQIALKIFTIRGIKVMLDSDLAFFYGIKTKVFNQTVKRNKDRFPEDFMFRLNQKELENLRSQFVTSSLKSTVREYGGRRYLPYVFTENGVAMLSSVLKSERAIKINIAIMRAFTRLRYILATNNEIKQRIEKIEAKLKNHDRNF